METKIEIVVQNKTEYHAVQVQIESYTCSDGRRFTNEQDYGDRLTGKQQAERHELYLKEKEVAKAECNYISLSDTDWESINNNEGHESKFMFLWRENLSTETKEKLQTMVFDFHPRYGEKRVMKDNTWYLVEQNVYEIPSSSRNCQYECEGFFGPLSERIEKTKAEYEYYKWLEDKTK